MMIGLWVVVLCAIVGTYGKKVTQANQQFDGLIR